MNRRATQLLRATLLDGALARQAWDRWTRVVRNPVDTLGRDAIMARPLMPLIYNSVRRNELPADRETMTLLRSAYLTESLRSRAYRDIVDELIARLAGVEFLLIKGAAVGELYYAEPALRHAHDIEIVARDFADVRGALEGSRFRFERGRFLHESNLELRVHDLPLWDRTIAMPNGVRTLDATQSFQLALTHAGPSGRWACDAYMIVRRAEIEFGRVAGVRSQLRWLRDHLGVEIPAAVTRWW
jgi:hypothetical protein